MSKILLLSSGLKHAQEFTAPLLKRLEVYLSTQSHCVDVRNILTFDERTFFEYDQVVFIFMTAMDSIPSSTLEIFQKLENQEKPKTQIYTLIACDEYETEKCDLAERIVQKWCDKEHLEYMGSLKVGSILFIMKKPSKFVVSNYIKKFSELIIKKEKSALKISTLTEKRFLKTANRYWDKQIKKTKKAKNNE
ncbi:MAG: hypothetical protein HFF36_06945 [Coprobacillus sp.]|nr:hypothetical protein [Coprobacillus sp.]